MRRALTSLVFVSLLGSVAPQADAKRWWSYVEALANDGMEGRNTGSPAHKRAASTSPRSFKRRASSPPGSAGTSNP